MKSTRVQQRFEHFQQALGRLSEINSVNLEEVELIVLEGYVQRFEYTFELAWKLLKDVMDSEGLVLETVSPKSVIRQAYEGKYISNVELWMSMSNDRNRMSHTYDFAQFKHIIARVKDEYYPELSGLMDKIEELQ